MANKKTAEGFDFLVSALKANAGAVYADLASQAHKKGLKVYPVMFGRAKSMLGLVKAKPKGQGRVSAAAGARPSAAAGKRGRQIDPNSTSGRIRALLASGMKPMDIAKRLKCTPALVYNVKARMGGGGGGAAQRGPGRRAKATSGSALAGLDSIVEAVRTSSRETEQLRAAVAKIRAVVAEFV